MSLPTDDSTQDWSMKPTPRQWEFLWTATPHRAQLADIPCRNAPGEFARSGKISALDHAPYGGTGATEKRFDYGLPDIC